MLSVCYRTKAELYFIAPDRRGGSGPSPMSIAAASSSATSSEFGYGRYQSATAPWEQYPPPIGAWRRRWHIWLVPLARHPPAP
jgi:hypothetical protein